MRLANSLVEGYYCENWHKAEFVSRSWQRGESRRSKSGLHMSPQALHPSKTVLLSGTDVLLKPVDMRVARPLLGLGLGSDPSFELSDK
jgi:hypothetical protein